MSPGADITRAEQLQSVPAPTDPRLHPYTRLTPGYGGHSVGMPLFGQPPNPRVTAVLERTPYGPVAALAHQLPAGARTEWDVVVRVHRYLLDGDRFHYTTNLPEAGPSPLVDFLLRGHAGYCQHFAGAAALLLRLAGVPARVAVGFATGVRRRPIRSLRHDERPLRRSRRICPAQVECLIDPVGSRTAPSDRLDDQTDDQSASDRESDGMPLAGGPVLWA